MTDDDEHADWAGRLPATPESGDILRARAHELRIQTTPPERRLWYRLKGRQRLGFKFRCQHVIDRFIVDFYCAEARLVIEIDGETHHLTHEQDQERAAYLEGLGLRVLRFTNAEVRDALEGVVRAIEQALGKAPAPADDQPVTPAPSGSA